MQVLVCGDNNRTPVIFQGFDNYRIVGVISICLFRRGDSRHIPAPTGYWIPAFNVNEKTYSV